MNVAHALERLMLTKLVRDYCAKHGVEYDPHLQVCFQRVGKHIQQNIKNDADALCARCKKCEGGVCKLS